MSWICDGLSAVPSSLLAIALMAVLGGSVQNVIVSLVAVSFPGVARIARASAMVVKEQTYIEAMRAAGARTGRILLGHIAPNILSPVIVQVSFVFASAIITEAALSFLVVGVPVPEPSWGNILNEGKEVIYKAWWMILFPGLFTADEGRIMRAIEEDDFDMARQRSFIEKNVHMPEGIGCTQALSKFIIDHLK